jgi:hypothetical protein
METGEPGLAMGRAPHARLERSGLHLSGKEPVTTFTATGSLCASGTFSDDVRAYGQGRDQAKAQTCGNVPPLTS